MLASCATPHYEADADAEQLVAAMQELPTVKPYLADVQFYPEPRNKSGIGEAENADERNLSKIIISEDEMLNLAGHASIFRWFQNNGKQADLPLLNVHARIYKLDHSIKVVKGRMQPIAKTKIEVFLTDSERKEFMKAFLLQKVKAKKVNCYATNVKLKIFTVKPFIKPWYSPLNQPLRTSQMI